MWPVPFAYFPAAHLVQTGAPPTSVSIASGATVRTLGAGVEIFGASGSGSWDGDRVWSPTAVWVPQSHGCVLKVFYAANVGSYNWWGANTSIGHRTFRWHKTDDSPQESLGTVKATPPIATRPLLHLANTPGDTVGLLFNAAQRRYEVMWDADRTCGWGHASTTDFLNYTQHGW